jgi:hypothetical protein
MKKTFALLAVFCSLCFSSLAQSISTSITYNKAEQPALMLELPYDENLSQEFILDKLRKTGYEPQVKSGLLGKSNKINGFYVFKGVRIEGVQEPLDLYFRVEQKSKVQQGQSLIYLLSAKGNDQFISAKTDDASLRVLKKFFNAFVSSSEAYKREIDVRDQEYAVNEAQRKMDKLKEEEKALAKKLEMLQSDIKRNQETQASQQQLIISEKQKLGALKSKGAN